MKVISNTIKEIRIGVLHKTSIENLTLEEAISGTPELYWCNGVLFDYKLSTGIESDRIFVTENVYHILEVVYAECKDRIEQSKWNGYSIEVVDFSNNPLAKSIVEHLKGLT